MYIYFTTNFRSILIKYYTILISIEFLFTFAQSLIFHA